MNRQQYTNLLHYLDTQQYPDNFSQKQQQQLKKAAKYFTNIEGTLYYQDEIDIGKLQ